VAFALALAFELGGRDAAATYLVEWRRRHSEEKTYKKEEVYN